MNVAIIPARGGSKRIRKKNIREFSGRPIIAYSIDFALQSGLFDRVIVSTDDVDISRIARHFGAEVPFLRPASLSDDSTGTTEVIAHAINWLSGKGLTNISAVCCLYSTAPFMRQQDLREGLSIFQTGKWQYVFSATSFSSSIFRSFRQESSDGLKMFFPEKFDFRSQDLPEVLHDAGQFYWGQPYAWLNNKDVFTSFSSVVRVPRWCVQDIDTEEDWCRAEAMAAYLCTSTGQPTRK